MLVLQMGIPGAPELIVILLILFIVGLPVVLAVLAAVYFLFLRDDDEE